MQDDDAAKGDPAAESAADGQQELRADWVEGPIEDAPEESWLALDDDELLLRIETLGADDDQDQQLLEVVASQRHFFVRQEAAKRVIDRKQLFAFEDDRHIGQILVRHLNRREDLTYLERLSMRSKHAEVRSAAQVQLARVWKKLEAPASVGSWEREPSASRAEPPRSQARAIAVAEAGLSERADMVDASLLCWAAHFVVEHAWSHLGTTATREILRRTRSELVEKSPVLAAFQVTDQAHVAGSLDAGARLPRTAVRQLAEWMTAFRAAAAEVAPEVRATGVRACTALMADALRQSGFYDACDVAEGAAGR